jgi:hypothetical protein
MEGIIGTMIPIFGIGMIVAIVWINRHFRDQEKQRVHETVRLLVEKGQPISSEMLATLSTSVAAVRPRGDDLRRGMVLIAVALAMVSLGWAAYYFGDSGDGGDDWSGLLVGVAAFPGFIGLGYLIFGLLNRNKTKSL